MTEKDAKRELIRRAVKLRPSIHIGKDGLSQGILDEITNQLKNSRLIKIKVLPNSDDDCIQIIKGIKQATKSTVIDVRGKVITITDMRTWVSLSQKKF